MNKIVRYNVIVNFSVIIIFDCQLCMLARHFKLNHGSQELLLLNLILTFTLYFYNLHVNFEVSTKTLDVQATS